MKDRGINDFKIEERIWKAVITFKNFHCGTVDSPEGRFPSYLIGLSLVYLVYHTKGEVPVV